MLGVPGKTPWCGVDDLGRENTQCWKFLGKQLVFGEQFTCQRQMYGCCSREMCKPKPENRSCSITKLRFTCTEQLLLQKLLIEA